MSQVQNGTKEMLPDKRTYTVEEVVAMGRYAHRGLLQADNGGAEAVERALQAVQLQHKRRQNILTLSGGERRRVEIARALATDPAFILLDEPFAGIDPIAVADIQGMIAHLAQRGIGVLITDHNVRETLSIVDKAYILAEGHILLHGDSETIANDPVARKYYLGDNFSM